MPPRYRRHVGTSAIQELLTAAVAAVETRDDEVDESLLWPEERAAIGQVVPGRWWDWVMGRRCARRAIAELGVDPRPVLTGERREPLWPAEVVGAITHTRGYAAAAVARATDVVAVGIDAEPDEPLPAGVLERVSHPDEREWVAAARDLGVAHPDRLLFSAKESVYKAWYPLARRWLGFEQARIHVEAGAGVFEAEILVDGPLSVVSGRYASVGGVLLTAVEAHGAESV